MRHAIYLYHAQNLQYTFFNLSTICNQDFLERFRSNKWRRICLRQGQWNIAQQATAKLKHVHLVVCCLVLQYGSIDIQKILDYGRFVVKFVLQHGHAWTIKCAWEFVVISRNLDSKGQVLPYVTVVLFPHLLLRVGEHYCVSYWWYKCEVGSCWSFIIQWSNFVKDNQPSHRNMCMDYIQYTYC